MRRTLLWNCVLGLAMPAGASVQILFTSDATGLTDPSYAFVPTNGYQTDITEERWRVNAFPSAMSNPTVGVDETK